MKSYNGFTSAERLDSFQWEKAEWASGRRKRPSCCMACGQTEGAIDSHTEDYSKPYGAHIGAFELCYNCHIILHCRFNNPTRFHEYATAVADGWQYEPNNRNFGTVCRYLDGQELQRTKRPTGSRLLLDIEDGKYDPRIPAVVT